MEQSINTCHAVADLQHRAHLVELDGRVDSFELLEQYLRNLAGSYLIWHILVSFSLYDSSVFLDELFLHAFQLSGYAGVDSPIADFQNAATDDVGVYFGVEFHRASPIAFQDERFQLVEGFLR